MCCRTIVGALGEKHKIIAPVPVDPTTTAYTAGDAIIVSSIQVERGVFDLPNGNANVVEVVIRNDNATSTPKKGMEIIFFSEAPTGDLTAAINGAITLDADDWAKVCNRVQIVTANYVDGWQQSTARITGNWAVWNTSTDDKTALWYCIVCTEAQTYTAGGVISAMIDLKIN